MASLITSTQITVRTMKRAVANPDWTWQNNYEFVLGTANGEPAAWEAFLDAIVAAERPLHNGTVEFVRAVASTYTAEEGYQPQSMFVREINNLLGTRTTSGDALPRHAVLHLKKDAAYGRAGKMFLRGCLTETDVQTGSSLDWQLTPGATTALQTAANTFYTAIMNAITTLGGAGSYWAMIGTASGIPDTTLIRQVRSVTARSVSINRAHHRYFDRTP